MKKVSLMLGALALVLGLSQCSKEKSPVQAGGKQYIELTASNGNDGSKVNVDFLPSVMNLSWEEGDEITVSGGAEGSLTLDRGAGTAHGHFSGEIEKKNNDDLVFSYKKAIPSKDDDVINFNAQDGTQAWIKDNIYLEAKVAYNESGKYRVLMEMPYAVLKLDVSALVGTQNDVMAKYGNVTVATVKDLEAASSNEVYVAVPEVGSEKTYTFCGNFWGVMKTWTLEASTYYTAEGGAAFVMEPSTKFSVADGVTVEFSKGNLYWNGSAFKFEENQWDFRTCPGGGSCIGGVYNATGTPEGNVGLLKWSNAANAVNCTNNTVSGELFCKNNFELDGYTWRTLTIAEWDYLLGISESSRANASSLHKWKKFGNGVEGLVIFPDGIYDPSMLINEITTISDLDGWGAVYFPAAGHRYGNTVYNLLSNCCYWSSTPEGVLLQRSSVINDVYNDKYRARSIRLVR